MDTKNSWYRLRSQDGTRAQQRAALAESLSHAQEAQKDFERRSGAGPSQTWPIPYSHDFLRHAEYVLQDMPDMIAAFNGDLALAWDRVAELVSSMINDPLVAKNEFAVEFLETVRSMAATAHPHDTAAGVFRNCMEPVFESTRAASVAESKNSTARAWVLDEWRQRANRLESKRSFADRHAELIVRMPRFNKKNGQPLDVRAQTIERDWLPKND